MTVELTHEVWARCAYELRPSMRFGPVPHDEAIRCAGELGLTLGQPEGIRSVWVCRRDGGPVVWAAGEKAEELAGQIPGQTTIDDFLSGGGFRG